MRRLAWSSLFLATSVAASNPPVSLQPIWTLEGLSAPESVALSVDGRELYVSNVAGEGDAQDGNGFIARVSRDGKLLQRDWVTGLDGPKGLVLVDGTLYAADIVRVVAIDAATGKVRARIEVPGAKFLNDLASAPDGTLLASDSDMSRLTAVRGNEVSTWLEDARLRSINGLLPQRDRLLVTTMQGLLLSVDWHTHAITELANGLGDGDGIVALDDGSFIVGEWPGRLFEVAADGSVATILDTRKEERYWNDFLMLGDTLIAPHWKPGALGAYRIERNAP